MNYGKVRIFDSSEENDLTRDIPIRLFLKNICDSNGQHRYHCRRNHPRILAEPHIFYITKVIMIHNVYFVTEQDMIHVYLKNNYETFIIKINCFLYRI